MTIAANLALFSQSIQLNTSPISIVTANTVVSGGNIVLASGNAIVFNTSTTTQTLTLTTGGNVGIGTSLPQYPLQVSGNIYSTGNIIAALNHISLNGGIEVASNNNGGGNISGLSGGGLQFSTFTGAVGSEVYTPRMNLSSTGNVGIGTSTPAFPLDVNAGQTYGAVRINGSTTDTVLWLNNQTAGGHQWGIQSSGTGSGSYLGSTSLSFIDNSYFNATALAMTGNIVVMPGNVGIGTNYPNYPLDINGGSTAGGVLHAYSTGGFTNIRIENKSTGGRIYYLESGGTAGAFNGGGFGIYDGTSSAARLAINGTGVVSMPYQAAFTATIGFNSNVTLWPNNGAVFNYYTGTPVNRNSSFNATTGAFTAPVAGVYRFSGQLSAASTSDLNDYNFFVNGAAVSESISAVVTMAGFVYTNTPWLDGTVTCNLSLNAGDYVQLGRTCCNNNKPVSWRMTFSGELIG